MKRKKKHFDTSEKIEILDKLKSGETGASLARRYEMNLVFEKYEKMKTQYDAVLWKRPYCY